MNVKVYTLNAFAKNGGGGNPAGVVLDAGLMNDAEMQRTATEVGFSETAFVEKSLLADYKLRYFTPASEVDLCGHATIAAFYLMHTMKMVGEGTSTLETGAGILEVSISREGDVYLSQALPQFYDILPREEIAASLRISADDLAGELPIQIVSTGLRDILIPIGSRVLLAGIQPDFNAIAAISKKYEVIGYHLFTMDTSDAAAAECRNFAPLYDIPEESATGTSNGALLSYLYKYGQLSGQQAQHTMFRQGYTMHCPSEIKAGLSLNSEGEIIRVQVGGVAAGIEHRSIVI
ncbi:phenazine biosynthesis protein PhzF [Paenibacillus sp. IHB B 3415]|uniref:PhzF family phenazine biosynthesis protein n=1 Tax=Paenibacillus sp. IHB B 3415 TaxID=867080 RepID=UPI000574920B|nr:PhzF family phenazine biosynthesis protein [Paenibacillus sp. IHB B 3415]KHL92368.1 phenazine biosynthesis protein PhzF [Paenibacillus sp. IHB B 3415]